MTERLGMSPKDLVGLTCYEIVHDTKEPPAFCPHVCLLKDGKEHSSDTYEERLGGNFLITVSPIYDSDRTILGSVHVARDITEHVRMEKQLKEAREILYDIIDDTIRSSDVIHQLRDFMKKGEIELIPLNINETIKEVVNLTHRDAESKNISVWIDTNEDLPEVMGDKVQLQQVILNLVINGFDAMMYQDAGSRELVIQTEQDEDNSIHVAVQDTGMGIEEEKLEQIFEPFVSTKPEGMGLGLSINQYIINAHNGRMWATNNPDHGTTVHFTLPAKK